MTSLSVSRTVTSWLELIPLPSTGRRMRRRGGPGFAASPTDALHPHRCSTILTMGCGVFQTNGSRNEPSHADGAEISLSRPPCSTNRRLPRLRLHARCTLRNKTHQMCDRLKISHVARVPQLQHLCPNPLLQLLCVCCWALRRPRNQSSAWRPWSSPLRRLPLIL